MSGDGASPAAAESFLALLTAEARRDGARVFARFNGQPISLAALDRQSDDLAGALRRRGVARGDHVAVMMRNSPAVLALLFALAKAGAVWVPINVQQRGEGLRYQLTHSRPRLIIADPDLVPTIAACGAVLDPGTVITSDDASLFASPAGPFAEPVPPADATFAIMYTSGTTGPPKGVVVTHAMMRFAAEAVLLVSAARDGDVFFVWEPLYHIGGAQLLLLPLLRRIELAMVERFSARQFWDQVRSAGATHIHYLGGILQILLKQAPGPLDRDHGVRVAWGGGCPEEVWKAFAARFGVTMRECYGMTEASSITTFDDRGIPGSIGHPVPWLDVTIVDAAGRPAKVGERGEIVVHAREPAALFPGYFANAEATGRALRDGALHTGDLGSQAPDGSFVFHGRISDSVRCKGENVSAWELERVAATHPDVEDCAMIGVAADIGEQEIKLFVSPKPGAHVDPAELSAWLAPRLAPYQRPRFIAVVDAFERTASQRIMKHRLSPARDDCWDAQAAPNAPAGR